MPEPVWRKRSDIAYVESEGRAVLVDLSAPAASPMILSASAASIWSAIDGSRTLTEVVAAIGQEYDLDPSAVDADVRRFVDELAQSRLILSDSDSP